MISPPHVSKSTALAKHLPANKAVHHIVGPNTASTLQDLSKTLCCWRRWIDSDAMLLRPRLLHKLVIAMNIPSLVSKFTKITGVKVRHTKKTLHPRPHLLFIGLLLQPRILGVKPAQELGVVVVEDKELHRSLFLPTWPPESLLSRVCRGSYS